MLRALASFAFVASALPAAAEPQTPPRRIAGPVEAVIVDVRDGDTVTVAAFVWPMQTVQVAVRLRGVDALEMRGECAGEVAAAEAARDRLVELVGTGPVHLSRIEGDKYFGRVLADLSTESEPDLAARLLSEGLVARYEGGRRPDWCAPVLGQTSATARRG